MDCCGATAAAKRRAGGRLSVPEGMIITVVRSGDAATQDGVSPDAVTYAAIDVETGRVVAEHPLGAGAGDPLQLAGTIGPGRVMYQGTVGSVLRIAPAGSG